MPSPLNLRNRMRRAVLGHTTEEKYLDLRKVPPELFQLPSETATLTLPGLANLVLHKPYTEHLAECAQGYYLYLFTDQVIEMVDIIRARKMIIPEDCLNVGFLRLCVALIIVVRSVPSNAAGNMLKDLFEKLAEDEYERLLTGEPLKEIPSQEPTWIEVYYAMETNEINAEDMEY